MGGVVLVAQWQALRFANSVFVDVFMLQINFLADS